MLNMKEREREKKEEVRDVDTLRLASQFVEEFSLHICHSVH